MQALSVSTTGIAILELTGSRIEDHGDHTVVRTPGNPGYWWGNYVQVLAVPGRCPGDETAEADRWLVRFTECFPSSRHVAIGLPAAPDLGRWQARAAAAGLSVTLAADHEDILTLTSPEPGASDAPDLGEGHEPREEGYTVREICTGVQWDAVLQGRLDENALTHEHPHHEHQEFETAAVAAARGLAEAGHAAWFGAFTGGSRLAAQLGIVDLGIGQGPDGAPARIARYQSVLTDAGHRRRGLASLLIREAARWAAARSPADLAAADQPPGAAGAAHPSRSGPPLALVICANADSAAGRLYRRLGFALAAREHGVAGARLARSMTPRTS